MENLLYRFLVCDPIWSRATLFVRVLLADPCELKPELGDKAFGILDRLFRKVKPREMVPGTLDAYLADPDRRDFVKMFLLALISSDEGWQPNSLEEVKWGVFKGELDELIALGQICVEDDGFRLTRFGERVLLDYIDANRLHRASA